MVTQRSFSWSTRLAIGLVFGWSICAFSYAVAPSTTVAAGQAVIKPVLHML